MPESDDLTYLRRYLDDPLAIASVGPAVTYPSGTETADVTYMKRYLDATFLPNE